jgi:hypothetical protein
MALSPADFYAYSRATGAPLPEDPEERAQMAPEVLEFRRNQLKAPEGELVMAGLRGFGPYKNVDPAELEQRRQQLLKQEQPQESNPLGALGAAAAAVGALAGLGFGAKALMRRGQQIPKGPAKSATAGVPQVNLADMEQAVRRVASETPVSTPPPAPSKVAGRSVMPTEEEAFTQYRRQLETELPEPTAEELNFPPATSRVYGVGYRDRQNELGYRSAALAALEKKYPPSAEVQAARRAVAQQDLLNAAARREVSATSLTDIQKTQAPVTTDQFINAVESGEDQVTGRLVKQLNIADPWGESTIPPEVINPQQTTLLLPAAAISPREKAQAFLQTRFEELGSVMPGRYRRERAMGQDPAIVEAMELYASTGDPSVLSRLSETPSSPLTVIPRVQTELREKEEIPTSMFFKPTGQGEFIDDLFEKDIALTNKISNLGVAKQNIVDRLEEIDQLEPQLRFAAADEPEQGGYYTKMLNKMLFERQSLNPDVINADLGDAIAERNFVRSQMESLESLGSKYQMVPRQEGVRPFFELDPVTNEPIAETLEIRSGRPTIDTERKGGGGRNIAEFTAGAGNVTAEAVREILQGGQRTRVRDFDIETGGLPQVFESDRSQTGRSIGIYGIEPRNEPIADPTLRPTVLQREETKMAIRRKPQEGEALKTYMEEVRRAKTATPEIKRRSLEVSEALRRATIEGRDPQSVLKQFGIGI